MKFTLSWLRDYLDTEAGLSEITEKLTQIGLEVEEVIDRAGELAPFTVAHVISAEPHPDADKLRVCMVDTGEEKIQVVCGAPNARAGMKGVFARSGLTVPGTGLKLKPTKIRGVESNGMLVSEREMGLSDAHEGIIEMPDEAPVGAPFAPLLGYDDPVIEIAITPNRQDCLGVFGIARDLAAAGLGRLKMPDIPTIRATDPAPVAIALDFPADKAHYCPVFASRVVRGLNNGPSPEWMQKRLTAIGLRPISALVDITNYVMIDLGRPLHVFDADRIAGDTLRLRPGKPGEKLTALDEKTYTLDDEVCVIADDSGAISIGGIMGGEGTGCTAETRNVLIESAYFDPIQTAMTGRRLGIDSDARYRFERGVDPAMVVPGLDVATALVLRLCGGSPCEAAIAGSVPDTGRTVRFRPARVAALAGIEVDDSEMRDILTRLGFQVDDGGDVWNIGVPSWRRDIDGEADIVEEVVRIHGFDGMKVEPLPRLHNVARPTLTPMQKRIRTLRRVLAGRGMMEAITWAFMPREDAARFGGGGDSLILTNPISADLDAMRPTPLPNLVAAAARNAARGRADLALFEIGAGYRGIRPEDQLTIAAGLRHGRTGPRHWAAAPRGEDVFDAKADLLAALAAIGVDTAKVQIEATAPDYYHPGRSGTARLGPKIVLGHFGELHPTVLERYDLRGPAAAMELFLDAVPLPRAKGGTTRPPLEIVDLPAVERDFAFILSRDIPAEKVLRAVRGAEKKLIEEVEIFDVYEGEHVGEGEKSLAFSVRLQPRDKTLTDAEIEAISARIIAQVEKATGGRLRG